MPSIKNKCIFLNAINYSCGGGGYFSLSVMPQDATTLYNCMKELNISDPIPPRKMHSTIMYDVRDPLIPISMPKLKVEAHIIDVGELGNALVLSIKSFQLERIFNMLSERGFKHSYPVLNPHISLKYNPTKEDIANAKENLMNLLKKKNLTKVTLYNFTRGMT